jgi:hypothetical protein
MPARNGDAGLAAHGGAAFEHAANHFGWQLGNGHAHQCQRHDGRAAHGVDVGQRIGGGNAAKVVRVVDDGGEKIGGGHQRLAVVEAVNRRVVAGFCAHQQLGRHDALRCACQNLLQQARRYLATATAAVRELGKTNGF